eukprot:5976180-Pleurochrysis_carterae.AAC.1
MYCKISNLADHAHGCSVLQCKSPTPTDANKGERGPASDGSIAVWTRTDGRRLLKSAVSATVRAAQSFSLSSLLHGCPSRTRPYSHLTQTFSKIHISRRRGASSTRRRLAHTQTRRHARSCGSAECSPAALAISAMLSDPPRNLLGITDEIESCARARTGAELR